MTMPKDFQRVVRWFILKRVGVFLLIYAVLCAAITFACDRMTELAGLAFKVSAYIFCFLIALPAAGIPKLMDRTFYGKVVRVEVKTTIDNESSVKPTREQLYHKNTVYLTVETDSGRTIRRKVQEAKAGLPAGRDFYQVGDRVFHLYGTKHTIVIPDGSKDYVRCPVCGEVNHKSETCCRSCAHTLVKI